MVAGLFDAFAAARPDRLTRAEARALVGGLLEGYRAHLYPLLHAFLRRAKERGRERERE